MHLNVVVVVDFERGPKRQIDNYAKHGGSRAVLPLCSSHYDPLQY